MVFPKRKTSISSGAAPVGNIQGDIPATVFMLAVITPQNKRGEPQDEARCWSLSRIPIATETNEIGIMVKSIRKASCAVCSTVRIITKAQMMHINSHTSMQPITFPVVMEARVIPDRSRVCSTPRSRSSAKMHTVPMPPILHTAN